MSTAVISAQLAVTACAAMAVSYVAILYAPFLLRLQPPTSLENYMLRRFACAAISSAASVMLTASLFGIGRFTDMASLLGVYGIRFNHYMWRAAVFPLLLTSLVYAGSIVSKIFLMISYRRRVGLTCCSWNFKGHIHAVVFNVMTWRNYVVAPFTEELVFRACMIPLLLCGGFETYKIVFLSPVFFSLAHLNHFLELHYQQNYPFLKAFLIVSSLVILLYSGGMQLSSSFEQGT